MLYNNLKRESSTRPEQKVTDFAACAGRYPFTDFLQPNHKSVTLCHYNELNDQRRIALMKPTKLFHVLFSLTVIAALVFAAMPVTPAHAMPASSAQTISLASTGSHSVSLTSHIVVCRSVTVWRHHHRVTIRVCHRVHRHDA